MHRHTAHTQHMLMIGASLEDLLCAVIQEKVMLAESAVFFRYHRQT
jgi:hypothetical protein